MAKSTIPIEETDRKVLADVRYNGADFTYTYKFNCQSLPQVNAYANAWLDSQGRFRIDYLPVGGKYVLVEKEAPKGYNRMKPVLFHISESGRSIQGISNEMAMVKAHYVRTDEQDVLEQDTIAAVTIRGRIVLKNEVIMRDEKGREALRFIATGEKQL